MPDDKPEAVTLTFRAPPPSFIEIHRTNPVTREDEVQILPTACPHWADGVHAFVPQYTDDKRPWPDAGPRDPHEGNVKICACGAEVKAR